MRLKELHAALETSITYPADSQSVTERIGGVPLDAPGATDTLTVGAILSGLDEERYDSAEALYETIYANLPDGYVGRKYYSDRGGHVEATVDSWADGGNRSF
jgi:hypothetical protein